MWKRLDDLCDTPWPWVGLLLIVAAFVAGGG